MIQATMDRPISDAEVLAQIEAAFAATPRPEHFTNHTQCDECWEHDELLRARDLQTLTIQDVGSQAWNAITMATPAGFAYYLPALARLALEPLPKEWDWYDYIILFELRRDGPRNARWAYCTARQRSAVCLLLEHLYRTRMDNIKLYDCELELLEALEVWSGPSG
jgi:hypothetical protein